MKKYILYCEKELETIFEKMFPPKKTTHTDREKGLRVMATGMSLILKTMKAFGGCEKCWGKGYGTQIYGTHGSEDFGDDGFDIPPDVHVILCSCARGKQLHDLVEQNRFEFKI